ncbi:hypothetical protein NOV72_03696 [Caballeronia novacaledonica]|uniref:Uncharacterized protein n=1 Tax=Caballeronia novacaledonica TaxID=1544861 RepID=A0A2U3I8M2_9BURK|nr:hypothetical protein [Caballeronia novacaledonica]SPB16496.1 hypothetical protein NOV72_03696 [Caballeronia novacaledonica]
MTTPDDVIAIFEQMNFEGKDFFFIEGACVNLAKWLASSWDELDDNDIQILMTVGATLWRESMLGRRRDGWRSLT